MGDLMRLRLEILSRLQKEGVLELNRDLQWPDVPSRIAVISAPERPATAISSISSTPTAVICVLPPAFIRR